MQVRFSFFFTLVLMFAASAWSSVNLPAMTWATHTVPGTKWTESVRSDWLNVLDYGADPTGSADSTAAIQAAMNAASGTHHNKTTVYLPAGTYKITRTLYWNSNFSSIQFWPGAYGLWLVGCGRNTTLRWAGAPGHPMLLDQGSSRSHYEGIVWNAGPPTAAAGFGVAHVSISSYQTRMRHDNEAFIGFTGVNGRGTLSPPFIYTLTSATVSTQSRLPPRSTTLPLHSIPPGLVVGAGVAGYGIATGTDGSTTTTITAISASPAFITISAPTNRAIPNNELMKFTSTVPSGPETVPAAGIFAGSRLATSPMAETMIWNCLFQDDTTGVNVGYEEYNNYMWIFKDCEFDACGTAINGGDGKLVVMDTHFSGSAVADVSAGVTNRLRRCTSSGSRVFFNEGGSGVATMNVFEDCCIDGWTDGGSAIILADRTDTIFDCKFTNPPAGAHGDIFLTPSTKLDITLSNNSTTSSTVPVTYFRNGIAVNIVNIPPGELAPVITSASQTFLQSAPINDSRTVLDVTTEPYRAGAGPDSTAAIQKAIDQAKKNGNGTVVYIPAGAYPITAPLNVSGGNYTIQGSGWASVLSWRGEPSTVAPIFNVTTPHHITIQQIQLGIGSVAGVSHQPCISETSTGPSDALYDEDSSGAYTSSPGVLLTSLPAGSTVLMPACDSALTVNNCGAATILSNFMLDNGVSIAGATHAPTGFTGALVLEGGNESANNTSGWDVTIDDNQNFIACDYYVESTYNHLLLENTHNVTWTGSVAIQGFKQESRVPSPAIDIRNFGGRVFYGSQVFLNNITTDHPTIITRTGTAPVDLLLIGDVYYVDPTITLGTSCNAIEANNLFTNPRATYLPDVEPPNWGTSAAASLDLFRQAGAIDLSLNYKRAHTRLLRPRRLKP